MSPKFDVKIWLKQSLPQEHGSWAFVVEPLLISWIVGGVDRGVCAIGFFLAFLGYRPGLIGFKDAVKRKSYPRTLPSLLAGGLLVAAGLVLMAVTRSWIQLGCLAAMGGAFLIIDAKAPKRSILREAFGALLAVPAACVVAPNATGVLAIRPIVSVLSVRGLIARWDDAKVCRWLAVGIGAAMLPVAWIAFGMLDWRLAAYGVCFARAMYSALIAGKPVKPVQIGIAEMLVSLAVIAGWLAEKSLYSR
ncbi:MAG: YwiC-like family protein [Fimbriimonas sp.]|nr:YwiC-like family protein [Fimbriimonas sp.]